MNYPIDPRVDPIANNSCLKLDHDLASLKILNNLRALNAPKAVKAPPDTFESNSSKTYSTKEIMTITASKTFKESR